MSPILDSADSAHGPRHLNAAPEFPLHVFPRALRHWVVGVSADVGAPDALAAVAALGVAATAAAKRAIVVIHDSWLEHVNLYLLGVAATGIGKTPIMEHATRPLLNFQLEESEGIEAMIAEARAAQRIARITARAAASAAAKDPSDPRLRRLAADAEKDVASIRLPTHVRLFTADVTPERLGALALAQGGRIAVISSEGAILERIAKAGSGRGPSDIFLHGHASEPHIEDRVSRECVALNALVLTILVMAQPYALRKLGVHDELHDRGFWARFLYVLPDEARGVGGTPLDPEVAKAYERLIHALLRIPVEVLPNGELIPHHLVFDSAAQKHYVATIERLRAEAPIGTTESAPGWMAKLPAHVARFAGLLCLLDAGGLRRPISVRDVEHAGELAWFFAAHARAAFATMRADPALDDAEIVRKWITRKRVQAFSEREAFNDLRSPFREMSPLRAALRLLVDIGEIEVEPKSSRAPGMPGRPRSLRYRVVEACDESRATPPTAQSAK